MHGKYSGTCKEVIVSRKAKISHWKERSKSYIVKTLMFFGDVDIRRLAECLGISTAYFNNKLTRNSFSFDDMVTIANACSYDICFVSKDKSNVVNSFTVSSKKENKDDCDQRN